MFGCMCTQLFIYGLGVCWDRELQCLVLTWRGVQHLTARRGLGACSSDFFCLRLIVRHFGGTCSQF